MNKKIILGIIVVAIIAIAGVYLVNKSSQVASPLVQDTTDTKEVPGSKTYTNTKDGYTFEYPTKLSLSASIDGVNLTHSIPFENTDGGCDMVGNGKVSKTLGDFNILISVAPGQIKPPYVDGTLSAGSLNGDWAYKGAEGCGQTVYYFPISGNRTLIVTKQELQILSPVVAADVRNKVLAVPGVISYEESNKIIKEILSTFKFTSPTTSTSQPSVTVLSPNGGEMLKFNDKNSITWDYIGLDIKDTVSLGLIAKAGSGNACWIKGIPVGNKKLDYVAGNASCDNGVKLITGDQYKVELIVDKYNTGKGVSDESDNYFTIIK